MQHKIGCSILNDNYVLCEIQYDWDKLSHVFRFISNLLQNYTRKVRKFRHKSGGWLYTTYTLQIKILWYQFISVSNFTALYQQAKPKALSLEDSKINKSFED